MVVSGILGGGRSKLSRFLSFQLSTSDEVVAQSLKFLFLTLGFVACGSLGFAHRTPVQTG